MVKRKGSLVIMLSVASLLSSCRFSVLQKSFIRQENIWINSLDNVDLREASLLPNVLDDGLVTIYEQDLFDHGFAKIKEYGGSNSIFGAYSYYSHDYTNFIYSSYSFIESELNGNYICMNKPSGKKDVFDFACNMVLEDIDASKLSVIQSVVEKELREQVILEKWILDEGREIDFIIDKNNERTSKIPVNLLAKQENGEYIPAEGLLNFIGLAGRRGSISSGGTFSCGETSFKLPEASFSMFAWKSLVYQKDNDGALSTGRIDILTGEEHLFDIDYKIVKGRPLYTHEGEEKYFLVDVIKSNGMEARYVLDNKFNVTYDATNDDLYADDLERLTNFLFFSKSKSVVFDNFADPLIKEKGKIVAESFPLKTIIFENNDSHSIMNVDDSAPVELGKLHDINISYLFYQCGLAIDEDGTLLTIDVPNKEVMELPIQPDIYYDTGVGAIAYGTEECFYLLGYNGEKITQIDGNLQRFKHFKTFSTEYSLSAVDKGYTSIVTYGLPL